MYENFNLFELFWLLDCSYLGTLTSSFLRTSQDLKHFAKHHMLAVQMRRFDSGDEELRAVGIPPSIRHRQQPRSIVLQLEVLVLVKGEGCVWYCSTWWMECGMLVL